MRYSYAWIPGLLIKIKNPLCVENPLKSNFNNEFVRDRQVKKKKKKKKRFMKVNFIVI
jgi:hypothetical protein